MLLPRLTARLGPTPATLLLALIWIAWHLPLFLVHTWSTAPHWFFAGLLLCVSVMFTFGYNLAGGSILAAILAHFTLNSAFGIYGKLLATSISRPGIEPFKMVLAVMAATAVALIIVTRGRLGRPKDCP